MVSAQAQRERVLAVGARLFNSRPANGDSTTAALFLQHVPAS